MEAVPYLIVVLGIFAVAAALGASGVRGLRKEAMEILAPVAVARNGSIDARGELAITTPEGERIVVSTGRTKYGGVTTFEVLLVPPGLPVFAFTRNLSGNLKEPSGPDKALAQRMWTHAFANGADAERFSEVTCTGTTLTLRKSVFATAEVATEGIDFALRIAHFDAFGLRTLAALPEATVHGQTVELPGPTPIHVGPVEQDGITRTSAWTAATHAVDEAAHARVAELGATLEATETELRIAWPSIEDDRERLLGAIEILRRLASGATLGAFR